MTPSPWHCEQACSAPSSPVPPHDGQVVVSFIGRLFHGQRDGATG